MIDFVTNYKFVMFNRSTVRVTGSHISHYYDITPVYLDGRIDPNPLFTYSYYGDTQTEVFSNLTDISNDILLSLADKMTTETNSFKDINKFIRDNNISQDFILSQFPLDMRDTYTASSYQHEVTARVIFSPFSIYENPIDNSEVFQLLNGISQVWSTNLSDDDYKKIKAIELYNSNFIKWYSLFNSSDNLSSSSSNVDLSTINTQLTNIANNLKVTEKDDQQQDIDVSIAEIEKNKQLYVVNNIDIADKLSMKPKFNGYPDDEEVF